MSVSSMAADFADVNRDGHDDFIVVEMLSRRHELRQTQRANVIKPELNLPLLEARYQPEVLRNTLFLNRGDQTFAEIAYLSGLHATEWTWSAAFLDVDLDGFEDLLLTTGNAHDVLDSDALAELAKPASSSGPPKNLSIFPRLNLPKLAYRNRGDLTFEEAGKRWGFDQPGVAHGMALGDLDNDGDLDVVINNFQEGAGLYRNESSLPRVAVRLRGRAGNGAGIGARVRLLGRSRIQQQEFMAGGRYLSSDQPQRTFAAPESDRPYQLEVRWRSGAKTLVHDVAPDHLYEIAEPLSDSTSPSSPPHSDAVERWFDEVSPALAHLHQDELYDDFARQPLLWKKLSHPGPGLAWGDLNGDGWEDLVIAAGKGSALAAFLNQGGASFLRHNEPPFSQTITREQTGILIWPRATTPLILAGSSNYEDGLTAGPPVRAFGQTEKRMQDWFPPVPSSTGPIALADFDGDGDLDLFVGGRAWPGRYPEPASSQIFRNDSGAFTLDIQNSRPLEGIGLVNAALCTDLNQDGYPDLVLAREWSALLIFWNDRGALRPASDTGLEKFSGWWNSVISGDFDGDGRLDLAAGNWGRNTKFQPLLAGPIFVYSGDFDQDSRWDLLLGARDPVSHKELPFLTRDLLAKHLPLLAAAYPSHHEFAAASLTDIVRPGNNVNRTFDTQPSFR